MQGRPARQRGGSARGTRCRRRRPAPAPAHGRGEAVLGDPQRQLAVAVAEGARHAAAARRPSRGPGRPGTAASAAAPSAPAAQRLGVAVLVHQHLAARRRRAGGPRSRTARSNVDRRVGHPARPRVAGHQARQVVDEHRPARGLQHHDRRPGQRVRRQPRRAPAAPAAAPASTSPCDSSGRPQQPGSTTSTGAPQAAEHPQRRLADPGLEVAGERVGHQGDAGPSRVPIGRRPAANWPAAPPRPHRGRGRRRRGRGRRRGRRGGRGRGAREPRASSSWAWPARRAARGTPRARWRWARASTFRRGHVDAGRGTPWRRPCSPGRARGPRADRHRRGRPGGDPPGRRAGCTARPRVEWRSSRSAW